MKWSFEGIMKRIEWIAILIGGAALVLSLFGHDCKCLTMVAGGLCLLYITYAGYLWLYNPKFDWHLIHGHFLWKVIAFVLLVPSFFASGYLICNWIRNCRGGIAYSPKNLVYEENLYIQNDTLVIAEQDLLRDSAFIKSHHLDIVNDSTVVIGCKLLDPGISCQKNPSIFWTVYYHFIDPGNQHMTTSQSGRGWSALIAILGVFLLNGILVSSIVGWVDRRKEKWLKGEVKYPYFLRRKKHYVIIGGNDMVFAIVRQIFKNPTSIKAKSPKLPYILIQTSRDVEEFRRELFSTLTEQQQQHIVMFYGSRTSEEELKNLWLQQATEVYILGEQTRTDELEPYHDTINMQCFDLLTQIAARNSDRKNAKVVKCYVMFEYQTSFAAFQSSNQPRIVKTKEGKELLAFIPFSPYESWAQTVLVNGNITTPDNITIIYNNIDEDGISYDSDKTVHIIIVGMSKMGTAMAIETAHLAHFPNFVRDNSKRTKITFIDKNAREESDFFMGRFPDLFKLCKWTDVDGNVHNEWSPTCDEYKYFGKNFLDIEWEFRNGGVESEENREYLKSCFGENSNEIITIAVCLPWPHQSLAAALYLPKVAIHKANDIWVYQPQSGELLLDINKNKAKAGNSIWDQTTYRKLKPFGMLSQGFDANLLENEAIMYCENFYKAKDALVSQFKKDNDNDNTCYWDHWNRENVENAVLKIELSIGKLWAIWSNIYQINTLDLKWRSLDLDFSKLDSPDVKKLFAEVEHNRWNVEKLLMSYKPLEDHILDKDEIKVIKKYFEYLKSKPGVTDNQSKCIQGQLDDIQEGINEKDIYYDWRKQCFKLPNVKNFYKNGPMKIHPNICPFECLPMDDKNYDICFTLAMPFLREKTKIKN